MAKFCIQTIDNNVGHDFGFQLRQYTTSGFSHDCSVLSDVPLRDYIPIGSIEFVHQAFMLHNNFPEFSNIPDPINIPDELNSYEFLKRKISIIDNKKDIPIGMFAKSMTMIKGFSGIVYDNDTKKLFMKDDIYLVSEPIDILSEWRCFVLDGKLLDVRCYSGDFKKIPNFDIIENMISIYKNPSYTLDVAVISSDDTVLIEAHNFYSCGLYGFSLYDAIKMWKRSWRYLLDGK